MKHPIGNSGQSQILLALGMGIVMLTTALYSLDYSRNTQKTVIQSARLTEMNSALDAAIKQASYLYHTESGCDPFSLNEKLSRMKEDGSLMDSATAAFTTKRRMRFNVRAQDLFVSFGTVKLLTDDDPTSFIQGFSHDAVIEVWTSYNGRRVQQRAALINTCTFPCETLTFACPGLAGSYLDIADAPCPAPQRRVSDPCTMAAPVPSGSYHVIRDVSAFPGIAAPTGWNAATLQSCNSGRKLGDLDVQTRPGAPPSPDPTQKDGKVGVTDLRVLQNYLRSGETSGTATGVLIGGGGTLGCGDFNRDGLVNEIDLNILEKALRGYLYWLPTHY